MTDFCTYHPTQPAWWRCSNCRKYLCPQCIDQRKGGALGTERLFFCPRCNMPAAQLSAANIVQPFWKRLHKCFAYPFASIQSIGLIFGLALLSTLFSRAGLFGAVLRFIPWAIMVKYAYEALRFTSEGRFRPPPFSAKVLTEDFGIVFKQIALFIALSFCFGLFIASMNPFIWVIFGIGVLIGLPAMIIILAINDNLGQALNPVYFMGMAVRIGWGYLLLFFFLFLLVLAPGALGYAVIRHMPQELQLFFWMAAKNYYTLVSYHLMGYVILQYHDRLDHHVDIGALADSAFPAGPPASDAGKKSAAASGETGLLAGVGLMIQEGDMDGAIALIKQRTQLEIDDVELSERYLNLLKMRSRRQEFAEYAPRHLDLLVKAGEKTKAMELFLEGSKEGDHFAASSTALFKIGSWLNEKGDARTAILALNRLIKLHPQDALIPKAYYRAALILHEKLMNTEKAKKVLGALIVKYPDHEIAGFARNYLNGI